MDDLNSLELMGEGSQRTTEKLQQVFSEVGTNYNLTNSEENTRQAYKESFKQTKREMF